MFVIRLHLQDMELRAFTTCFLPMITSVTFLFMGAFTDIQRILIIYERG